MKLGLLIGIALLGTVSGAQTVSTSNSPVGTQVPRRPRPNQRTVVSKPVPIQLVPLRTYNGIGRPFRVSVRLSAAELANCEVRLLAAVTQLDEGHAKITSREFDLAKLFPDLWKTTTPHVQYAQLFISNKPVGPALVLQPILNPSISRLKEDKKTVEFVADEDGPMYNGIRAYVDQHIVLDTTLGQMEFRLRPDAAPNTVWNIRELVRGGYYTETLWHRIVAKRKDGTAFVIQGGDPTGTGSGGPGFAYPLENSALPHDFGVISIARSTDPNTNGGQIFVCLSRDGTKHLDGKYASFGEAVRGADAILKTAAMPVGKNDRPENPPRIRSARLVDANPYPLEPKAIDRDGKPKSATAG